MGLDTGYDSVETTVACVANFPINTFPPRYFNVLWESQFFWRRWWSPSAMIPNLKSNANCYMLNQQTYVVFLSKQLHIKSMIIFLTVLPVWPAGFVRGQCFVFRWVFSYKEGVSEKYDKLYLLQTWIFVRVINASFLVIVIWTRCY